MGAWAGGVGNWGLGTGKGRGGEGVTGSWVGTGDWGGVKNMAYGYGSPRHRQAGHWPVKIM